MRKTLALLFALALLLSLAACAAGTGSGGSLIPKATEAPASVSATAAPETPAAPTTEAAAPTETAAVPPDTAEAPSTEAPATEAPTEVPTTEEPQETVDPWTLLGEASFEQGSFTDSFGYMYSYSYDIPCLLADTPDARAINAEIDEVFGGHVREALKGMEDGDAPVLLSTGFIGHVWEDILTIEIVEHTDWGFDNYGVFCYAVSTGERLSTADVVQRMGFTEEEFLDSCRNCFRLYYEEMYSGLPEDDRAAYGYYRGLDRQITDEFVNMDLLAYPENDDIVVIAPIVSLAGADYYFHTVYLGIGGDG